MKTLEMITLSEEKKLPCKLQNQKKKEGVDFWKYYRGVGGNDSKLD